MLNAWKYGNLCENLTFIGYFCEICSMCENMAIFEVCSVSDGHYTESGNWSVFDEEKGRHAHTMRVSYLRRRETFPKNKYLISEEKGDVPTKRVSPFYLICTKNIYWLFSMESSLRQHAACSLAQIHTRICANGHVRAWWKKHHVEHKLSNIFEALRLSRV
jgi:hypothetical protein